MYYNKYTQKFNESCQKFIEQNKIKYLVIQLWIGVLLKKELTYYVFDPLLFLVYYVATHIHINTCIHIIESNNN